MSAPVQLNDAPPSGLVDGINRAAIDAGATILDVRRRGAKVEIKADKSPVTEADRAAEELILARLGDLAPGVATIAEESIDAGREPALGRRFFLVDPLDGTREFARGGDDFTVNIGLVEDGLPVLGVIYVPVTGALYFGEVGRGAWRAEVEDGRIGPLTQIAVRPPLSPAIDVVASRSHRTPQTNDFIARFDVRQLVSAGSSLKFCVVAEGGADLYPRMGTTMQWDTAAGEAILRAAGGRVVTMEGTPLPYGPNPEAEGANRFLNPWFIATGGLDPLDR